MHHFFKLFFFLPNCSLNVYEVLNIEFCFFFFQSQMRLIRIQYSIFFTLLFFFLNLLGERFWSLLSFVFLFSRVNAYSILNFIYSVFFSPLNCSVKKQCSLKALFFSSRVNALRLMLGAYGSSWSVRFLRINLIHNKFTDQVDPWATCGSTWSLTNLWINKTICGSHYHIRGSSRMSWVHKKYFKYTRGYFCLRT